jgi:hypothetical protein
LHELININIYLEEKKEGTAAWERAQARSMSRASAPCPWRRSLGRRWPGWALASWAGHAPLHWAGRASPADGPSGQAAALHRHWQRLIQIDPVPGMVTRRETSR